MIKDDCESSLLMKLAWYYYFENMTQQQISDKLGISRMKVIKLLEKAKQNGIINFHISQEKNCHLNIEKQLIEKWQLEDAFVIPSPQGQNNINELVAQGAAQYINTRLGNNMFLNMGYGDTASRVLNHLAKITETLVSVVSLTGGVSYYLPNAQSHIFNARLFLYPVPLIVSSQLVRDEMQKETCIQEIERMIRMASFSIVGIGGMGENATVVKNGVLSHSDFLYLSAQGAVGDILTHFINKDGSPVDSEFENRLFSTSLETLKTLQNVIAISGGHSKVPAIRAAIKGGYIDILVTDEYTAQELLKDD